MAHLSYPTRQALLLISIFSGLSLTFAVASDDDVQEAVAINHFQAALNACDRGLESPMPKSRGSLRVLQSLLKRYYRNRDDALKLEPTLKDSEIHRFTGSFFTETTYSEAYRSCEDRLPNKIAQAEEEIAAKQEARQQRQQERAAEMKRVLAKIEAAKEQVTIAINQHCLSYLRSLDSEEALNEGVDSPLYPKYQAAQRKAFAIYPDILKQFHDVTLVDTELNEEQTETKTVDAWFAKCDEAFTADIKEELLLGDGETIDTTTMMEVLEEGIPTESDTADSTDPATAEEAPFTDPATVSPATASTDLEGPMMPPRPAVTDTLPVEEAEPFVEEAVTSAIDDDELAEDQIFTEDEELAAAINALQGGKRKTLQKEGRFPDYMDDEDFDLNKSKYWQYEADDGSRCTTYTFRGNDVIKTSTQGGECPPF